MTIEEFISRVSNLNAKDLIIKAVSSRTEELADFNVENMDKGLLSTGKKIKPDYSKGYAAFKGFKTPNLKLEGDFHSGVYSEIRGDKILFDSKDYKTSKLEKQYSADIFGVKSSQLIEVVDMELSDIIDNEIMKGL